MLLTKSLQLENAALITELYHYRIENQVLLAKWSDTLSVESEVFLESLKVLFRFAAENNVKRVLLDCGIPEGGTLTEDLINYVQEAFCQIDLEKLAVLETIDFHWDNNLLQFLHYMKESRNLPFQIRFFSLNEKALDWLAGIQPSTSPDRYRAKR